MAPSAGCYRNSIDFYDGCVAGYIPVGAGIPLAFQGEKYSKRIGKNAGSGPYFSAKLRARPLPYTFVARGPYAYTDVSVLTTGYSERPYKYVFYGFAHGILTGVITWIYSYDYTSVISCSCTLNIAVPSVSSRPGYFHLRTFIDTFELQSEGRQPTEPGEAFTMLDTILDGCMSDQNRMLVSISQRPFNGTSGWEDFELELSSLFQVQVIAPTIPHLSYKYDELNAFVCAVEFDAYLHPFATGFKTAYVDAINKLPVVASNTLANVIEAIDALKTAATTINSLRKGRIGAADSVSGRLAQAGRASSVAELADPRKAWLTYRYAYNTSVSDAEEYKDFVKRIVDLQSLCCDTVTVNGFYREGEIRYSFSGSIDLASLLPSDVAGKLRLLGLEPSLTNTWDLIPYSFMVDWFIDVSGFTEWLEQNSNSLEFTLTDMWYSAVVATPEYYSYWRVPGRGISLPSLMVSGNTSTKTWAMRLGDSVSIFTK